MRRQGCERAVLVRSVMFLPLSFKSGASSSSVDFNCSEATRKFCSVTLRLSLAVRPTVTGALSQASERKIVTVQPWVEQRDGKRYLHIPEGAGYRNLIREMPPQPVPQAGP